MQPDNDHRHNRLYAYFKTQFKSKTTANSITGLSVALGSSGFALVGYVSEVTPITSHLWLWLFVVQAALYALIFLSMGKAQKHVNKSGTV